MSTVKICRKYRLSGRENWSPHWSRVMFLLFFLHMVAKVKKTITHCIRRENAILRPVWAFNPWGLGFVPKQNENLIEETLKSLMKLSSSLASFAARNPCAGSRQNAMNARTDCIQVIREPGAHNEYLVSAKWKTRESFNEKSPACAPLLFPLMSGWCVAILEVQAKTGSFSQASAEGIQAPIQLFLPYSKKHNS